MNITLATHLPNSGDDVLDNKEKSKKLSFKDKIKKLSNDLLNDMQDSKKNSEAKKLAKKIHHIGDLKSIYLKYEKPFADMIARYAIKQIIDHEIEYGHYEYLHDVLLSHKYLNEQEKYRVEKNINKAALKYIKRHNGSFLKTKIEGISESLYDFQQLVKIIYTEYLSEETRQEAKKVVLKRAKNKKEFGKNLLFIKNNDNLPQDMREIAGISLEEHEKIGLGKYQKR